MITIIFKFMIYVKLLYNNKNCEKFYINKTKVNMCFIHRFLTFEFPSDVRLKTGIVAVMTRPKP